MQIESAPPQTKRPPLRAVREAQGLSLRQAAELAGVDIGHLSRVERGASLSLDALARLAEVLSLRQLAELLGPYRRKFTENNGGGP